MVCTHLKAKKHFYEQRIRQVKEILATIQIFNEQFPTVPVILMGDLNAEPDEQCIKGILDFQFKGGEKLQSAYDPSLWTTCKQREVLELRTIDYIMFKNLNLIAIQ